MGSGDKGEIKILVVDDDAASRGLMGVLLAEYGLCSYAINAAEAIEVITKSLNDKEPFDLICLDILMSEMDGLECLKKIREIEQSYQIDTKNGVKVIMTTTVSQQSKVMRSFHYGCSGYLVKPISKENLAKEINKLPLQRGLNTQWRGR